MSKNTIGIKYGILAGVGLMLYFLLFYYMDKNRMMEAWVSWSSLFLVLICTFLAVSQQRETNSGIIEFKEALKTGFTVIVLSNLLYYAFFFVLLKSDPELVSILKQNILDAYKSILSEEEWTAMEKSYENFSFRFSEALLYFAKSTIGEFFIALLVAALLKRSTVR
jgi:hypothetical protein